MGAGIQWCPWCGHGAGPHQLLRNAWTVRCFNPTCWACGPTAATEVEAVFAWNQSVVNEGPRIGLMMAEKRRRSLAEAKAAERRRKAVQRKLAERQTVFV